MNLCIRGFSVHIFQNSIALVPTKIKSNPATAFLLNLSFKMTYENTIVTTNTQLINRHHYAGRPILQGAVIAQPGKAGSVPSTKTRLVSC